MRTFIILLLSLCLCTPLRAAVDHWYRVELYVFAQTTPNTSEHFNPDLMPHYDNQAIQLSSSQATLPLKADASLHHAATNGAWRLHSRNNHYPVSAMASRMERSDNYRTLFYGRWLQPVAEKQKALPISIQGGHDISGPATAAPRPMSADTTTSPATDTQNADNPEETADSGSPATATFPELQGTVRLSHAHYLHFGINLWFASHDKNGRTFFTRIKTAQRLKDGDLRYFDNPLFGVVVRVTPLKNDDEN